MSAASSPKGPGQIVRGLLFWARNDFVIKMRNELAGTDSTLFTGKMKVGKVRSNEQGPKAVNKFVYYVDHDWNLPIGYAEAKQSGWSPIFFIKEKKLARGYRLARSI